MATGGAVGIDEYRMQKLNMDNHYAWNIRARAAMVQKKIWIAIEPGFGPVMTNNESDINERALTFLFLIVEDSYLDDIGEETRAKAAWETLKEMCTSRGLLHKLTMMKEFVKIEKKSSETMKEYITRFTEKQRQMQDCGFAFNDRENAGLLLAGLFSRYEVFVTSNFNQDENDLEMEIVKTKIVKKKIIMEEKRISHLDGMQESRNQGEREPNYALTSKNFKRNEKSFKYEGKRDYEKPNKNKGQLDRKGYIKCYSCNKYGHVAKYCPEYLEYKKNEEKAKSVSDEKAKLVMHRALCTTDNSEGNDDAWLLDTGATDHMSSQYEKFTNFKEHVSTVEVANKETMKVEGIGDIFITLKKNNGGMSFKLERVLYVPELGGNLLSIGRISEKGLIAKFEKEIAKIVDEDGHNIIKAEREKGLYTVYEEPKKANAVKNIDDMLWHRRLGHLNVKTVKKMVEDKQLEIIVDEDENLNERCKICIEAKLKRMKFPIGKAQRAQKPLELVHTDVKGKEVDVGHLRVFGSKVWAAVNKNKRVSDFDAKAKENVLIGYSEETKGYKLWNWRENKVFMSRDVIFEENKFPLKEIKNEAIDYDNLFQNDEITVEIEGEHSIENSQKEIENNEEEQNEEENIQMKDVNLFEDENDVNYNMDRTEMPLPQIKEVKYSDRVASRNEYKMKCALTSMEGHLDIAQLTVKEALSGREKENWHQAMKDEIESLTKRNTWELTERPKFQQVIGCKWIFRKKYDEQGNLIRYKARLVAQGFAQVQGVDFNETYSPVVKMKSLRLMIGLIVEQNWEDVHVDVVSAYVQSKLNEDVYMEQPEFFVDRPRETWVLKLKMALYGLHQSGREWNRRLDMFLKGIGMKQSKADPCIYYDEERKLILGVYVDDIIGIGNKLRLDVFVRILGEEFEIQILGGVTNLLSIRVERPMPGVITLDQEMFADKILEIFQMSNCKGAMTPLDPGTKLSYEKTQNKDREATYRRAIGSLLYLAGGTRPDLAFAVTYLSQFNDRATEEHWKAVQHVLRYLKKTKGLKLVYSKTGKNIEMYADSDWGSDKTDRRSWSGYVVKMANGAISWRSRKQKTVALSTVESEYVGMCEVAKEAIWWKNLLSEIGMEELISNPIEILVDNQGAISLAKNKMTSDRSKHIDLKHHFIRELVEEGKIEFKYVQSENNLADMLTKVLSGKKISEHSRKLGMN